MSLLVWLPLDGDLRNLGLSDALVTTPTVATFDNAGKIGKCLLHNNKVSIPATLVASIFNNEHMSIAFWYNNNGGSTSGHPICGFLGNSEGDSGGSRIYDFFQYPSKNDFHWSMGTLGSGVLNGVIPDNTWIHICVIYNSGNLKIYINGILKHDSSGHSSAYTFDKSYYINFGYGQKLNDFRIYDHALSLKEVKEIAKGLVLHYPLNKPLANMAKGGNTYDLSLNSWVFSNLNGGTVRTLEYDEYGTPCVRLTRDDTAASGWSYFHYDRIENIKTNTTYTISFDIKASVSGTVGMSGFMHENATNLLSNSNSNILNSIIANKWNHIILLTTTKSDFSGLATTGLIIYMSLSSNFRNTGATMLLKNIKLEEGNKETPWIPNESDPLYAAAGYASGIVYDCSGYLNNGTEVGTITGSSDTPRYRSSSKFSNSSYITYLLPSTMYYATYSFWLKFSSFTAYGAINMLTSNPAGGDGPWFSCNTEGAQLWAYFGGNSPNYTKAGSGDLLTNTWYHCVYVWDNGVAQWYLNGEKLGNAVTYTDKKYISNSTTATIGNSYTGSAWYGTPFNGLLSDVRVYATALSAADVKALYDDAGYVDKNGNFHAYEFVEI